MTSYGFFWWRREIAPIFRVQSYARVPEHVVVDRVKVLGNIEYRLFNLDHIDGRHIRVRCGRVHRGTTAVANDANLLRASDGGTWAGARADTAESISPTGRGIRLAVDLEHGRVGRAEHGNCGVGPFSCVEQETSYRRALLAGLEPAENAPLKVFLHRFWGSVKANAASIAAKRPAQPSRCRCE